MTSNINEIQDEQMKKLYNSALEKLNKMQME